MRLVSRGSVVALLLIVALAISWLPWQKLFTANSSNAEEPSNHTVAAAPQELDRAETSEPSAAAPSATPQSVPTTAAPPQPFKRAPAADPYAATATKVVLLINTERRKAGCTALRTDERLAAAATAHSQDMVRRNYFSHTAPDGIDPWQRAKAAGYTRPTGENIAMGYPTAEAVVAGWLKSPGHRDNIMNCKSQAVGMGIAANAKGIKYWTQLFGAV